MESIFVFNDTATTWIYTYRHTSFPTRRSSDLLDDGSVLTEITAICEYLEERFPDPALIGTTAEERAKTRMWTRRVDLKICEPLTNGRSEEHTPELQSLMRISYAVFCLKKKKNIKGTKNKTRNNRQNNTQ